MRSALAAALLSAMVPMASATVLTFDDLSGLHYFVSDYNGFRFGDNNLATNDWYWDDVTNPDQPPRSGTWLGTANPEPIGFTGVPEDALAITSTTAFKFDGAWFSGDGPISYKLYSGGTLVFSSVAVTLNPDGRVRPNVPPAVWIGSGYGGLVTGVVVNGIKQYYAMDDFTFNSPVPEVQTYALMLAGLALVGAAVRRRAA
jgi:hypothetical protein